MPQVPDYQHSLCIGALGSPQRPCCHRPTPPRCCFGRCSHPVKSPCERSTAGKPSLPSPSISRLTSQPEAIPSCYRRSRHTKFQPHSGRHLRRNGLCSSTVSTLKEVPGPPTRRLINPFQHRQLSVRRSSAPWHDKNGTGSLASSPRPVRSAISIAQPWPFLCGIRLPDRSDRSLAEVRRDNEIADRASDTVAVPGYRQPPSRNYDADCLRVWIHAGKPRAALDGRKQRLEAVGTRGPRCR
jgi:hypothetical protein